jgi:hypothetical protein
MSAKPSARKYGASNPRGVTVSCERHKGDTHPQALEADGCIVVRKWVKTDIDFVKSPEVNSGGGTVTKNQAVAAYPPQHKPLCEPFGQSRVREGPLLDEQAGVGHRPQQGRPGLDDLVGYFGNVAQAAERDLAV